MIDKLKNEFCKKFDYNKKPNVFFAPGRINIIGEHIDYNGGLVLPFAINLGTYAFVGLRNDDKINFVSKNFQEEISIKIADLEFKKEHNWANYPKSIISKLSEEGFKINQGFDVMFYGNLPNGAGLSSSASIELVTALMLNELFDFDIEMIDLVKLSQKAENEYMKLSCGIMDQFAIGMSKKNHALLLNSDNLDYDFFPLQLGDYKFIVTNSMKKRKLTESKYNQRQNECDIALEILQKDLLINNLCQLSFEDYKLVEYLFENEDVKKRVLHVVTENERTKLASEKLKDNDLVSLGKLLNESHLSLKNNYEVTGFELDTLFEIQTKQEGVLGSRMTGAGFGGCTISLINKNEVENFCKNVKKEYFDKTKINAEFYLVESEAGARKLE